MQWPGQAITAQPQRPIVQRTSYMRQSIRQALDHTNVRSKVRFPISQLSVRTASRSRSARALHGATADRVCVGGHTQASTRSVPSRWRISVCCRVSMPGIVLNAALVRPLTWAQRIAARGRAGGGRVPMTMDA